MRIPRKGSFTDKLSQLQVGERIFIETTLDSYRRLQSRASAPTLNKMLESRKFSAQVWTAVGAVGESVILVSITRTE